MAIKNDAPENNLGSFLTLKKVSSIDIYALTTIPTPELSLLRSGDIKKVSAEKLYLMAKVGKIDLKEMLEGVYPDLKLNPIKPTEKKIEFESILEFFMYIEEDIIEYISQRTGITIYRLKRIKYNKVIPTAHQLYLIELATKVKPGTLFKTLYRNLQLNTPEVEAERRLAEKDRSSKK